MTALDLIDQLPPKSPRPTVARLSDGELLDRFLSQRDESAFARLMERHGAMVLSVCRRMLGEADADDAFQAVFLLLVRKGRSIRKTHSLASWLHGVALRVALRARTANTRRRAREKRAVKPIAARSEDVILWRDVRAILDEEIAGLPEKLRSPLVLCDLEGRTFQAAADALGLSSSTLATRIVTARQRLRSRLQHRGVTLGGFGVVALLAPAARAAVPTALREITLDTASLLATGKSVAVIPGSVATLMKGGVSAMSSFKSVWVGIIAAVAVLASAGAAIYAGASPVAANPSKDALPETAASMASTVAVEQPAVNAEDFEKDQLARLKGTWQVVEHSNFGKKIDKELVAKCKIKFEGNKLTFDGILTTNFIDGTMTVEPGTVTLEFKIAKGDKANHIDLALPKGASPPNDAAVGVFTVDGDQLKLCYVFIGDRPTEAAAGDSVNYLLFKRIKEKQ